MDAIAFWVPGKPATAGSKTPYIKTREDGTKTVALAPADPRSHSWMASVAMVARREWGSQPVNRGPVALRLVFIRTRPQYHFRTGRFAGELKGSFRDAWPTSVPDTTKLIRCLEDALTGVIWHDDAQVVRIEAEKRYGDQEGADVTVRFLNGG